MERLEQPIPKNDDAFPEKIRTAKHITGRESEFSIKQEDDPKYTPNLSSANYGNISRVSARVEKDGRFRERSLVLKRYKVSSPEYLNDAIRLRDEAVEVYGKLKEAGLENLPSTFRAVDDVEILMEDYNINDNIAIAHNKIKEVRDIKIESLTNFEKIIDDMFSDLVKASVKGIIITGDAYFVVIPKKGNHIEIKRVAIADLEMVHPHNFQFRQLTSPKEVEEVYKDNVLEFAGVFAGLNLGGNFFVSEDYLESLSEQAKNILLSPDRVQQVREDWERSIV